MPSPPEEAVRDLLRLREALKGDRRRAMQRVKAFLLRHGCRYPGCSRGWSAAYERWVRAQQLGRAGPAQRTLDHLLAAYQMRHLQLQSASDEIRVLAAQPPLAEPVARLGVFRGIDILGAATIAAEVCDFRQFARAPTFMGYTGLVPGEHSSGDAIRRGSITKTGNAHVRRILVEAAWAYRHRPAVGQQLRRRQQSQPAHAFAYPWSAQLRLHARFQRLAAISRATRRRWRVSWPASSGAS